MIAVAPIGFRVGITANRLHIVVQDTETKYRVYLDRTQWDSYVSPHEHWADVQSCILTMAQRLGWSK